MFNCFFPDEYLDSTYVINFDDLYAQGLCICGIRNDSNRPGIHSGKSDIQMHSGILFF